jgi:hypothetical protein
MKQIDSVEIVETSENINDYLESSNSTTLTAYYTLLRRSLTKTASISGFNLKIKFEF